MRFHETLRLHMAERGLPCAVVGRRAGRSKQYIAALRQGYRGCTLDGAWSIGQALQLGADDMEAFLAQALATEVSDPDLRAWLEAGIIRLGRIRERLDAVRAARRLGEEPNRGEIDVRGRRTRGRTGRTRRTRTTPGPDGTIEGGGSYDPRLAGTA